MTSIVSASVPAKTARETAVRRREYCKARVTVVPAATTSAVPQSRIQSRPPQSV